MRVLDTRTRGSRIEVVVVPSKSCSLESKSFNSTLHSMYIRAGLHHTPGSARVVLVGYRFNTVCFVLCVLKRGVLLPGGGGGGYLPRYRLPLPEYRRSITVYGICN